MALTAQEKLEQRARFTKDESNQRSTILSTKPQLAIVIDAIDDWVEANQQSFNQAIPQPMRSELTLRQKLRILEFVINRRYLNE